MNLNILKYVLVVLIVATNSCCRKNISEQPSDKNQSPVEAGTRDPLKWPFEQKSIWNMPIGSGAVYVHARIEKALAQGLTIDEDYIVMEPGADLVPIYENFAGWDRNKSRCVIQGKVLFQAPIPKNFVVSPATWDGATPNAGLAVLMPDRRTIKQTQPFAFCDSTKGATSQYVFQDLDIYGPGMYGAHGGSGLSAIGGTLRLGELTPTSGPVRHALKVNIFGRRNIYYDQETKGYRWPARKADGYAANNYYKDRKVEVVKACRMGAFACLTSLYGPRQNGFRNAACTNARSGFPGLWWVPLRRHRLGCVCHYNRMGTRRKV